MAQHAEAIIDHRGHWGIEGRLHWIRDTAYKEDTSQRRTGSAAELIGL